MPMQKKLPHQLKVYFTASKSIKNIVTSDTINQIEDLYILYHSLYYFDTSEFSVFIITSLK